jgi:hypothetical protein
MTVGNSLNQVIRLSKRVTELESALESIRHTAEGQRIWNGTGWTYRFPFERIWDTATIALRRTEHEADDTPRTPRPPETPNA